MNMARGAEIKSISRSPAGLRLAPGHLWHKPSGTPITDKTEMEGMEPPTHYWVPSIAPSGMCAVTSERYPGWKGSLLVGSLSFQYLERLEMDGRRVLRREKLMEDIGRVRDVRQGPDGLIYVAVEGKGIYRLNPTSQN